MKKTPAATAKRLQSPRQLRALIAIQQQPHTVRDLMDRAGGNGIPQLIDALRRKGLKINTTWHRGSDRDERFIRYCTYRLSPESAQLADDLVKEFTTRGV